MAAPRPAATVPDLEPGIPPAAPGVDLRLDGNQGRAPGPAFFAALAADTDALRRYPTDRSLEQLLAARHGVEPERIVVAAGADDVLDRLCRAVLEPGRSAVLPLPTFEMLERYVALAGGRTVAVPWSDGPWPRAQVLAAADASTALVAIVSPNNPTGLVATAEDVRAACVAVPGAVVLVDAAYAEFGGEDLTAAALAQPNAVVVRTFSKAFGLAGLRVGYAIAPPVVARWLRAVGSPFTCGTIARRAAALRLQTGAGEVAAYVDAVAGERRTLARQLAELGAPPLPSAGNFVFVPTAAAAWLRDGLLGLGIAVRAFATGVRITLPGDAAAFARLGAALAATLRPEALLLDLDGVLADIDGRRALVAAEALAALAARAPIGVVTSCPRRLAESILHRHGFAPHVRALVTSEDGPGKPDPAPVRLALQRLGVGRGWMVGDNPSDVAAARGAGVVPLAVAPHGIGAEPHAERLRAVGAARLVTGLAEVLDLLAALPRGPGPSSPCTPLSGA
jgi:histidinol-phosphate aminotransferase